MKIIYHADDFGVSKTQSEYFINSYKNGKLNKISLFINSKNIKANYNLIKKDVENNKIKVALHINLLEGIPVTNSKLIPDLVDKKGYLSLSYFKLLRWTFSLKKNNLKKQIKLEIENQIEKFIKLTNLKEIEIDFHQHYHLFPIVHDVLDEIINENKYNITYIRIPIDPIKPILHLKVIRRIKIINIIKWIFLKFLYIIKPYKKNNITFLGLFFSCDMNSKTYDIVIDYYKEYAKKTNTDLEIMFHPGYLENIDECLNPNDKKLYKFISSKKRIKEYNTLINIK